MPARRRASATTPDLSKTLVLGFVGTEDLDDAEVEATLTDLFGAKGIDKVECIFSFTDNAIGDGAFKAYEFVAETVEKAGGQLALACVVDSNSKSQDDIDLIKEARSANARLIDVGDLTSVTVVDELGKSKLAGADARLIVFWAKPESEDDDPGDQYAALESAEQAGVPAFNICDAMDPLDLGGDGAAEEPAAAEPEPAAEEAPRRRRRTSEPAAEAEPETTAAVEDETPPRRRRTAAAKAAEDSPADEVQATTPSGVTSVLSDGNIASVAKAFAVMVAREVVTLLQEVDGAVTEEKAPARRRARA